MQKKIIVLAIAGLASSAALAQTNVTIYGVFDAGQAWVKGDGKSGRGDQKRVGRLDSNSSLLGFKGSEDLGNGLKALFQFESLINVDTNGGFVGGRDSYAGLSGDFGTLVAGILTPPMRVMGGRVEIMPGVAGFGTAFTVTGQISWLGLHTGADDRATNTIAYTSPTFGGGFSATVAYINGEARGENAADPGIKAKAWQAAGQYENGPIYVALAHHQTTDMLNQQGALPSFCTGNCNVVGAGYDASIWRAAATYTTSFGARFSGLYDYSKLDQGDINGPTYKRSAWSVGVIQTFGNNAFGLQYARSGNLDVSGAGSNPNDSARIWTIGYQYALSRRTLLQARYSGLKNGKDGQSNFYLNPVRNTGGVVDAAGEKYSGFMFGIRHAF